MMKKQHLMMNKALLFKWFLKKLKILIFKFSGALGFINSKFEGETHSQTSAAKTMRLYGGRS